MSQAHLAELQRLAAQSAAEAFATYEKKILAQIKALQTAMKKEKASFEGLGSRNWGNVGNLGSVANLLEETLTYLKK